MHTHARPRPPPRAPTPTCAYVPCDALPCCTLWAIVGWKFWSQTTQIQFTLVRSIRSVRSTTLKHTSHYQPSGKQPACLRACVPACLHVYVPAWMSEKGSRARGLISVYLGLRVSTDANQ